MNFAHPVYLLAALVAVAALVVLALIVARVRQGAIARFTSPALAARLRTTASGPRRGLKLALLALGVASTFVALARPRWGWRWEEARRNGVDILFAVDTSRSMLAEDVHPSRLGRAKLAVHDLVDRFDGDRAGLVAFAGEAFLQAPMTLDRDAFGRALDALDTETIPRPGTNVAAAIREARAAFGETDHDKVLVLLTDGESLEGDAIDAAREAARDGLRIFTVGIGSAEGALIPVRGADGRPTLLRGPDGELVRSRLDDTTLRQIAAVTHGDYEPFGASGEGLRRLYERDLATLPRHAIAERRQRVWYERFQWPLAVAVAALALEALLSERRRDGARRRRHAGVATALAAALVLPASAQAQDRPPQVYNGGVSTYRAGHFAASAEAFERSLRNGDPALQQRAYYDLGNARFRVGEASVQSDRAATRTAWQAAVHAYESALRLHTDDADARHNLDLVQRRLAALDHEQNANDPQHVDHDAPRQNGQSQGQNGQSQAQTGQSQGQNGQSQGQNGQSQGQNGQSQGQNGQSQAQTGQSQGQNGQSQGQNGQSQGQNGQSQAQNGQSQGQNGQPQATNAVAQSNAPSPSQGAHGTQPGQTPLPGQSPPQSAQSRAGAHGSHGRPASNATAARGEGDPTGQLGARDAVDLLDSMRHEERRWPLAARTDAADPDTTPQTPRMDW